MESVAEWYSQNLGTEVAKGKRERSAQGLHNNQAGFGLKKDEKKVLGRDEKDISGLIMAFEQYSTGRYSDGDVGHLLNEAGYRTKRGRLFSKETVRDMLQNQTYIGKTKYQKYQRKPDGSRSYAAPVEWFDGQHEAVIDPELFHRCQVIRAQRRAHRQATSRYNFYLLRNLVYCYRCGSQPPADSPFRRWGKMRCHADSNNTRRFYRCLASSVGYTCAQKGVRVELIDEQVVEILMTLKPPAAWREAVAKAFGELLDEQQLGERTAEIRTIMNRMDSRWDQGFVADVREYQVQRRQLQRELERLTPIPDDELARAVEVLAQFPACWQRLEGQPEAQSELVGLIVKRVYIQDDKVAAMILHQNYHLVLGHHLNRPTAYTVDRSSSDTSARLGLIFLPEHIAQQHFSMRPAPTPFT
jgi:hypothetical protein